jgi:hypothetical protein
VGVEKSIFSGDIPESLDGLANAINQEHRACEQAMRSTLGHARRAGELLMFAKTGVKYGAWEAWLKDNFEGKIRTAQGYMKVYREWDKLEETQRVAELSLRGALKELSEPREAEPGKLKITRETLGESERREEKGKPSPAEEREDYANKVAEMKERTRAREERDREARRKNHNAVFFDVDARLSKARREIKKALEDVKGVKFEDEEVELLMREADAARGMLSLFSAVLTGDSGTDWDAALAELEYRR